MEILVRSDPRSAGKCMKRSNTSFCLEKQEDLKEENQQVLHRNMYKCK